MGAFPEAGAPVEMVRITLLPQPGNCGRVTGSGKVYPFMVLSRVMVACPDESSSPISSSSCSQVRLASKQYPIPSPGSVAE
jgi:hypothetical protein